MKKIIIFYYTSYYKFFKFWQSDDDSARNAKGMIALIVILVWLVIFGKFYSVFISNIPLDYRSRHRFFGFLITIPIIVVIMNSIKTFYPNDTKRSFYRGLIVSLTIPLVILLMIFIF